MGWNIGDKKILFLVLILKSGLFHVVLVSPKTSPGRLTLTVVGMKLSPDIGKFYFEGEFSC